MYVCVLTSLETVFRTEKLKERIENLKKNGCRFKFCSLFQYSIFTPQHAIVKRCQYVMDFMMQQNSQICEPNWNGKLRKVTQYNLSLALVPGMPVDPSTTCAMLYSHWVCNNRDGNSSLP